PPEVAGLVALAVGDGALVLHAEVWCLDELVAVLVPRIRAEPALETLKHRLYLLELYLRRVEVIVERIEIESEISLLACVEIAEMRVASGVDGDVVVVDRIYDKPLVSRAAVVVKRIAAQPSVCHVDERIGNGDGHALAVRFAAEVILGRPPDTGAEP